MDWSSVALIAAIILSLLIYRFYCYFLADAVRKNIRSILSMRPIDVMCALRHDRDFSSYPGVSISENDEKTLGLFLGDYKNWLASAFISRTTRYPRSIAKMGDEEYLSLTLIAYMDDCLRDSFVLGREVYSSVRNAPPYLKDSDYTVEHVLTDFGHSLYRIKFFVCFAASGFDPFHLSSLDFYYRAALTGACPEPHFKPFDYQNKE